MEGYKLMYLVDKEVIHGTFGKGSVVNYSDNYIKINFESGTKRFVFPDVFKKYMTFVDQKAVNLVNIKIQKREEEKKNEELRMSKEKALERERQHILDQENLCKVIKFILDNKPSSGVKQEKRIRFSQMIGFL